MRFAHAVALDELRQWFPGRGELSHTPGSRHLTTQDDHARQGTPSGPGCPWGLSRLVQLAALRMARARRRCT